MFARAIGCARLNIAVIWLPVQIATVWGVIPGRSLAAEPTWPGAEALAMQGNLPDASDIAADVEPLPAIRQVVTHVYRDGVVTRTVSDADSLSPDPTAVTTLPQEKLIYSNTQGTQLLRYVVPNRRYADDIQTSAVSICSASRYAVRVNGGVPVGTGTFSCTTGLFTACPTISTGGVLIPGTLATFSGLSDDAGLMHDLVVDLSAQGIPLPTSFWVRVSCDLGSAGWVGGTPAEIGFSDDRFLYPNLGCNTFLSSSFYSAFYVQVWALDNPTSPCQAQYLVYSAEELASEIVACGANVQCADDFQTALAPTGDSCILSAYSVGFRGSSGPFHATIDMRLPFTGFPIPGTEFTFSGLGYGRFERAYHTVDPNIDVVIPASPLWVKWSVDRSNVGPINSHFADAGFSERDYSVWTPPWGWGLPFPPPPPDSWTSINMSVFCREEPCGACCPNQIAAANQTVQCQDDVPVSACPSPNRWLKDRTCAENAFDPPCGTHACCKPNGCFDLTYNQCAAFIDPSSLGIPCQNDSHCPGRVCQPDGFCAPRTGVWQNNGGFCDPVLPLGPEYDCFFYQCYFALNGCFDAEPFIDCPNGNECPLGTKCLGPPENICVGRGGCADIDCCDYVCETDPFCCQVIWDSACVSYALNSPLGHCDLPPPGDVCGHNSSAVLGPVTVVLSPQGNGQYLGEVSADNRLASIAQTDPIPCCVDPPAPADGTLWFRFTLPTGRPAVTSARIHTCATVGSATTVDSILTVFSVGDLTSEKSACASLHMIACNDDAVSCNVSAKLSDVCVTGLWPGGTYYVMLGSKSPGQRGNFYLTIEAPCPAGPQPACPDGIVHWLDPPASATDARQPHPLDDASIAQGIDALPISAAPGAADPACWKMCEAPGQAPSNEVLTVEDHGGGTQTLHLAHQIGAAIKTKISYPGGSDCTFAESTLRSLPGDVNGQGQVQASDAFTHINFCLNATYVEYGPYRCDTDRSGQTSSEDLVRVLDLLNGAGAFDPWLGRTFQAAPCE